MTTSTLPGLFDRVGLDLSALQRLIARLAAREPTPRPFSLPPLTRIRSPAAPEGELGIDAVGSRSTQLWIGGEPENAHVIGNERPG